MESESQPPNTGGKKSQRTRTQSRILSPVNKVPPPLCVARSGPGRGAEGSTHLHPSTRVETTSLGVVLFYPSF